jgi:oxygen-dependent protoporphyrinogen oxidase
MTDPGAGLDAVMDLAVVDVAVIGGGIAGLVAAWELARAGRRPVVLEASPTLGGCVGEHDVAGLALDSGAESFAAARPAVLDLARDLGLQDRIVAPAPLGAWAWVEGRAVPLPSAGLLGVPVNALDAGVRRALGPWASARAALDRLLPAGYGAGEPGASVSFGSLVRARMGDRVVSRLVEPVVGGVHSADPDDLDVDVVAPGLRAALAETGSLGAAVARLRAPLGPAGAAVRGLEGGVHLLIDALREALRELGVPILTGSAISDLRLVTGDPRSGEAAPEANPWRLTTRTPPAAVARGSAAVQHLRATSVVIAVTAPEAAALLTSALGDAVEGLLDAPDTTDVVLATLVLDEPLLDAAPRGTGILVARRSTEVTAKALTHATAKWPWLATAAGPGRHVLRLSYGRGGDERPLPEDAAQDVDALRRLATADAATLLGVALDPARVIGFAQVAWSSALPRPGTGHAKRVVALRAAVAAQPGLAVCGAWIAGNGLAAVVADARRTAGSI